MSEQMLKEILGEIKNVKAQVNCLEERFEKGQQRIEQNIGVLQQDMAAVKQDVSVLQQDMVAVKQDISGMKQDISGMKQDISMLQQDMAAVKRDINVMQNDINGLKQEVKATGQKVDRLEIRMENEVIEKIRALFDARQVHEDRFRQIMDKLDDISTDTRYLVIRVAKLEKLAK